MYGDYDDRNTNAELFVEEMQQPSIPTKAEADKVFSVSVTHKSRKVIWLQVQKPC